MFMGHYAPAVWDTQRGKGVVLVPVWMAFLAVQFVDGLSRGSIHGYYFCLSRNVWD